LNPRASWKTSIGSGQLAGPAGTRFWLRYVTTLSNSIYVWWVVCLLGAGVYAWVNRHAMNSDGLSYLDMASESLTSGPTNLINGLWSPLYPVLISVALAILRPSPAQLFPVVHLVNFVVFGFTLLAFTFFVRSLLAAQNLDSTRGQTATPLLIPFCFGVFFWFTMEFTIPSSEHPDLCVTAVVFLVSGLCCRISVGLKWKYYVGLGVALGLGYYAKAAMFPSALILFALLFVLLPPGKRARLAVALSVLTFLLVSTPLVVKMSKRVGHLSTSEAGPLNYALFINGLPGPPSWGPGVNGTPEHLPRTILRHPVILEFATPIRGTNPLGYDPTYWFAGMRPHFDLRQQLAVIKVNLRYCLGALSEMTALVCGALILFLLNPRGILRQRPRNLLWWLTLWPVAVCGMYDLVYVEARYVFGYLALLSLSLYAFLWKEVDHATRSAVLGAVLLVLLVPSMRDVIKAFANRTTGTPEYIRVGEALHAEGVRPGDSIAAAGGYIYRVGGKSYRESSAWNAFYARYAGVRVIAAIMDADDGRDMPERPAPEFWHVDKETLARVEDVLAGIGVRAIVAPFRPADSTPADWKQVDGTVYSILLLTPPASEDPLSENGSWLNGAANGLDWANVRTFHGLAIGAQPDFGPRYGDSTALLTGPWGPDQTVEATVHTVNQRNTEWEEVELRLRSTITPHRSTGYEIAFRCLKSSEAYAGIGRWNGPLGDWTGLATSKGAQYGVKDGDRVKATIVGNLITGYINGVPVVQATDNTYLTGAPGIGLFLSNGPALHQFDFGFTTFKATDGKRTYSTTFGPQAVK
jgi:hypothetical protein